MTAEAERALEVQRIAEEKWFSSEEFRKLMKEEKERAAATTTTATKMSSQVAAPSAVAASAATATSAESTSASSAGSTAADTPGKIPMLMTRQIETLVSRAVRDRDRTLSKCGCREQLRALFGKVRVEEFKAHVNDEVIRLVDRFTHEMSRDDLTAFASSCRAVTAEEIQAIDKPMHAEAPVQAQVPECIADMKECHAAQCVCGQAEFGYGWPEDEVRNHRTLCRYLGWCVCALRVARGIQDEDDGLDDLDLDALEACSTDTKEMAQQQRVAEGGTARGGQIQDEDDGLDDLDLDALEACAVAGTVDEELVSTGESSSRAEGAGAPVTGIRLHRQNAACISTVEGPGRCSEAIVIVDSDSDEPSEGRPFDPGNSNPLDAPQISPGRFCVGDAVLALRNRSSRTAPPPAHHPGLDLSLRSWKITDSEHLGMQIGEKFSGKMYLGQVVAWAPAGSAPDLADTSIDWFMVVFHDHDTHPFTLSEIVACRDKIKPSLLNKRNTSALLNACEAWNKKYKMAVSQAGNGRAPQKAAEFDEPIHQPRWTLARVQEVTKTGYYLAWADDCPWDRVKLASEVRSRDEDMDLDIPLSKWLAAAGGAAQGGSKQKQEHSVLTDACQPEKGQTKDNSKGCVGEGLASRWANDPKSSEDDDLPLATTPATASRGSAFGSDHSEKDRKDQAMQGRLELVYEV